jgi:hypothetical protein
MLKTKARADYTTLQGPNGTYDYDRANGPLASLETTNPNNIQANDSAMPNLFFPRQLHEIGHWIVFQAYETKQTTKMDDVKAENIGRLRLPVPANLATAYGLNYNQADLGGMGMETMEALGARDPQKATEIAGLLGMVGGISLASASDSAAKKSLGALVAAIGGAITGQAAARGDASVAAGAASDVAGGLGTPGQAALAQFGIARNPHRVVLFESVDLRSHRFSYRFVPQNRQESDDLYQIIRWFKRHSHPGYASTIDNNITKRLGAENGISVGRHFFSYPSYFKMQFHFPQYLFEMKPCFLQDISVDYHPAMTPSYANIDGGAPAPTAINISLTFRETSIVTRQDIDNNF